MKKHILFLILWQGAFILNAQNLISIFPSTGSQGQVLSIAIIGNNTNFTQASNTIGFNFSPSTVLATNVVAHTNTYLTATLSIPSNTPAGLYNLFVNNNINSTMILYQGFQVIAGASGSITSLAPTQGIAGQTLNVTITGNNTHFTQATNTIDFYFSSGTFTGTKPNYFTVNSNTSITANLTIPSNTPVGVYNMSVQNSINGMMYLYNEFYVTGAASPSIGTLMPSQGLAGQTLNVTISGNNTNFTQASNTVSFYFLSTPTLANSVTVNNNNSLTANVTIPAGTAKGFYWVSIFNAIDGFLNKNNAFYVDEVLLPSITGISPSSGTAGQTLNVTITGNNTHFLQASNTIHFYFSGATVTPNSLIINSNTSITANLTIPSNTYSGYYSFTVQNSKDGFLQKNNAFYVVGTAGASIASLQPSNGVAGQTMNIVIKGNNTNYTKAPNTVKFYFAGIPVNPNSLNVQNDSTLTVNVTIPANTPSGYYTVTVHNAIDGIMYSTNSFYVSQAATANISSLNPSSGIAGQTLDVTITGSNTNFSQASNTVRFYFTSGTSTYTTPNKITVHNNTSLTANITIPAGTPSGFYDVSVNNNIDKMMMKTGAFQVVIVDGTEPKVPKQTFYVKPNPFLNSFSFDLFSETTTEAITNIFDLTGKTVFSQVFLLNAGNNPVSMAPDIPAGIYLIKIFTNDKTYRGKILKQ
jgi:hypothetical protein